MQRNRRRSSALTNGGGSILPALDEEDGDEELPKEVLKVKMHLRECQAEVKNLAWELQDVSEARRYAERRMRDKLRLAGEASLLRKEATAQANAGMSSLRDAQRNVTNARAKEASILKQRNIRRLQIAKAEAQEREVIRQQESNSSNNNNNNNKSNNPPSSPTKKGIRKSKDLKSPIRPSALEMLKAVGGSSASRRARFIVEEEEKEEEERKMEENMRERSSSENEYEAMKRLGYNARKQKSMRTYMKLWKMAELGRNISNIKERNIYVFIFF